MSSYRFLLDEHMMPFVGLPLDLFGFDLLELRKFEPNFVSTATPDWVLYLSAAQSGLTGLITHDESQLSQKEEVRAMELTGIVIVTYRKGVVDELTKWGLLMAQAPRIRKKLDAGERGAFVLPAPGSPPTHSAGMLLHQIERRDQVPSRQLRHQADKVMKEALGARRLDGLWPGPRSR